MATNRFGYSDDFVLKNGKVGINTAEPQATLDVQGTIKATSLKTTSGVSTFTGYEGFLNADHKINESTTITNGASLSGEIIVGTGVTVTVGAVGVATALVGVGTNYTGSSNIDTTDVNVASQGAIESLKVYNTFNPPVGGTNDRPIKAKPGQLYYNQDFKTIEFWDGNNWRQVDYMTQRGRGIFGGFESPGTSIIDYVNIASTGNAIDFGVMDPNQGQRGSGCSSSTRGLFMGGNAPTGNNVISYITLASNSNGVDFGDLSTANVFHNACCSSSTRGLNGGGTPGNLNVIDYVEIPTIGSALDFGDLTVGRQRFAAVSSTTRGIWSGGYNAGSGGPALTTQDAVTISSKGNAVRFAQLDRETDAHTGCANGIKGLWAGGTSKIAGANWNKISYITLASEGISEHFGDLVGTGAVSPGSLASQTRGVFAGGGNPTVNTISYVQIATTGNSQDFGDLSVARRFIAGLSDSHGGLGGF